MLRIIAQASHRIVQVVRKIATECDRKAFSTGADGGIGSHTNPRIACALPSAGRSPTSILDHYKKDSRAIGINNHCELSAYGAN